MAFLELEQDPLKKIQPLRMKRKDLKETIYTKIETLRFKSELTRLDFLVISQSTRLDIVAPTDLI